MCGSSNVYRRMHLIPPDGERCTEKAFLSKKMTSFLVHLHCFPVVSVLCLASEDGQQDVIQQTPAVQSLQIQFPPASIAQPTHLYVRDEVNPDGLPTSCTPPCSSLKTIQGWIVWILTSSCSRGYRRLWSRCYHVTRCGTGRMPTNWSQFSMTVSQCTASVTDITSHWLPTIFKWLKVVTHLLKT